MAFLSFFFFFYFVALEELDLMCQYVSFLCSLLSARHTQMLFVLMIPFRREQVGNSSSLVSKIQLKALKYLCSAHGKTTLCQFEACVLSVRPEDSRSHSKAQHHCLHLLRLDECIMHDKQNIVRLDYSLKQRSTKVQGASINIQS